MANLNSGDVLLTRNSEKIGNNSPGYWNHAAILSRDNWVVEAQEKFGVIGTPIWYFFARYPEILVLRFNNVNLSNMVAEYSLKLIGRPYLKGGSFGPAWLHKTGDNCVSVIRRCYVFSQKVDPMWIKPDDILNDVPIILNKIAHKDEHKNFVDPQERFKGIIYDSPRGIATK